MDSDTFHRKETTAYILRFFSRLLGLLALAGIAACSSSAPPLTPLPGDAVVLAFGDSLTHGTGAPRDQSYPTVLEGLIGRRVVNAGVPGEISSRGLARLPSVLAEHAPGLVILCHGGNDFLRRQDSSQLAHNLEQMIRLIRESGAQVVLLGVPEPKLILSASPVYATVAERTGILLMEETLPDILQDRDLKSDTVHPNAAGYRRLATAIYEQLRDSGAL